MKKFIFVLLFLSVFFCASVFAADMGLVNTRNQIFEEFQKLKPLLKEGSDIILVSSMWDSCLVAVNQLDAYSFMIGIFNEVTQEESKMKSVGYLISWLDQIKKTNEANVKALTDVSMAFKEETKAYKEKLLLIFNDLNLKLSVESSRLSLLKKLKASAVKP